MNCYLSTYISLNYLGCGSRKTTGRIRARLVDSNALKEGAGVGIVENMAGTRYPLVPKKKFFWLVPGTQNFFLADTRQGTPHADP